MYCIGGLNYNSYLPNNIFNFGLNYNFYAPINMFNGLNPFFNFNPSFSFFNNTQGKFNNFPYTNMFLGGNSGSPRISPETIFGSFTTKKTDSFITTTFAPTNPISTTQVNDIRQSMVRKANSYVGVVNSSREGNRLFSPKGYQNTEWYKKYGSWGWCCDFAVYCAKSTLGSSYPKDMITSSPAGLAKRAEKHNAYLQVPNTNKITWLQDNIKPGDIIYMKGCGVSGKHIAVVDHIGDNGEICAISGNSGGKVKIVNYNINTSGIYGFVSLDRIS